MPVKTTILATEPVLVQQHELTLTTNTETNSKEQTFSATILTYGATLTHLICPDRWNQPQDVVLGFDHWQDYIAQAQPGALNPYFGSIIGPTASRVANATFQLETPTHVLQVSNGLDCHHGGPKGFDKQHWTTVNVNQDETSVTLEWVSPHGDYGYPGRLVSRVQYKFTNQGELAIEFSAQLQDGKEGAQETASLDLHSTIVSLTNHAYWNLDGVLNPLEDQAGQLQSLLVEVQSTSEITTNNDDDKVVNKALGQGLDTIPGGYGYDHVFALDGTDATHTTPVPVNDVGIQAYWPRTPHVATLYSPRSGIRLDLSTSEPAIVLYAAGYLDKASLPRTKSKILDIPSNPLFAGFCLEPIRFPDAIHHRDWAGMVTLHHDQVYRQRSVYKFSSE
ncbi:galactose mutarotase-like domain-containing protein [Linnemannia elongata]|nr:galactose mutarotase-like domain-containing protein [Linnemannia elongata]